MLYNHNNVQIHKSNNIIMKLQKINKIKKENRQYAIGSTVYIFYYVFSLYLVIEYFIIHNSPCRNLLKMIKFLLYPLILRQYLQDI